MSIERCPSANEQCRYAPDCYADTHHLYWPRRRYTAGVEKAFRDLPENKVELCRAEHSDLHAREKPPEKPSRSEMIEAIASRFVSKTAEVAS